MWWHGPRYTFGGQGASIHTFYCSRTHSPAPDTTHILLLLICVFLLLDPVATGVKARKKGARRRKREGEREGGRKGGSGRDGNGGRGTPPGATLRNSLSRTTPAGKLARTRGLRCATYIHFKPPNSTLNPNPNLTLNPELIN